VTASGGAPLRAVAYFLADVIRSIGALPVCFAAAIALLSRWIFY
jgi:hypothetical protein